MTNSARGTTVAVLLVVLAGLVGYRSGAFTRLGAAINGKVTVP